MSATSSPASPCLPACLPSHYTCLPHLHLKTMVPFITNLVWVSLNIVLTNLTIQLHIFASQSSHINLVLYVM